MSTFRFCLFPLAVGLSAWPAFGQATLEPRGELATRIQMARDRMLGGGIPEFTDDFILADVMLRPDYPRRFNEYSGDLSGRYIGAFAVMPGPGTEQRLGYLVAEALKYQKPDGRFGSADLNFVPDEVDVNHMALLWGNGRLLVGLLECYEAHRDQKVLDASRKLGDFLLAVREGCSDEKVVQKVKDRAAAGMICFTQLIEGLVMLARDTNDPKYLDGAEAIVPWFDFGRGQQHSHGYLSTLRGLVMLSQATGKAEYLKKVEDAYASLAASSDYNIYGGVEEMFGGKGDRNEGCSEADLLRLSLQLWQVTRKLDYLERAERCLLNEFFSNQFQTGDFGHHLHFAKGVAPVQGVGRAWWCCTMHGLRAFRDVMDSMVTADGDKVLVNLFLDGDWKDSDRALRLEHSKNGGLRITVAASSEQGFPLAIRQPGWAEKVDVSVNGQLQAVSEKEGYTVISEPVKKGDKIEISFVMKKRLIKRDGSEMAPADLTDKAVEAALFYGPWLVGADETDNPMFYGEPWDGNEILLSDTTSHGAASTSGKHLEIPAGHVACKYVHNGFPGEWSLVLRPISERTGHDPDTFVVWLNYRKGK